MTTAREHLHRHLPALRAATRRRDRSATTPAPWPPGGSTAPRVVVEHEHADWRWAARGILEAAGYEVACCGGPRDLPGQRCPLVTGDECPLVDGADVVVHGLRWDDRASREVLTALVDRPDRIPVVVEVRRQDRGELARTVPDCRTVAFPARPATLVGAVADALDRR